MRKISYTQMRAELSDILDAIRDGETVVVTQRGKPDTVLNGSHVKNTSSPLADSIDPGEAEHHEYDTTLIKMVPAVGSIIAATLSSNIFEIALKRTQKKHAKIIKALEDK